MGINQVQTNVSKHSLTKKDRNKINVIGSMQRIVSKWMLSIFQIFLTNPKKDIIYI